MDAHVIILSHLSPMIIHAKFNMNLKYINKRPRMHIYTHIYVCVHTNISADMFGKPRIQILYQIQYSIHLFIILFVINLI